MLLPRQPAGRAPASETFLLDEAERHSHRLSKLLIDASNASWKLDELIREVRLASGAARRDALARLATLLASYGAASVTRPPPARAARFRHAMGALGRSAATGAMGCALLVGFAWHTPAFSPAPSDFRSTGTMDLPAIERLTLAEQAARVRVLLAGICRDVDPDAPLIIHPVWRH